MVGNITGPEFGGVVGGGSAAGGNYVWVTLRLGGKDQTILIEKSRVGVLMTGLATAAGLARGDRIKMNPEEASSTGQDTAYALNVGEVRVGRSTDSETAILDVQIETDTGSQMNLYLAAEKDALVSMRGACEG